MTLYTCSECKRKVGEALIVDLYDQIVCYECAYEYGAKYAKEIGYNDRL